jgi:hypothetical protein
MRAMRTFAGAFCLVGVVVLSCAADPPVSARWATADGGEVEPERFAADKSACEEEARLFVQTRERWASQEWGLAVVDCLEKKGYERVPVETE